jgi:hypothetical protein
MTHLLDGSSPAMCVAALASAAVFRARSRSGALDDPDRMVAAAELKNAEHRQQCGLLRCVFGNPFRESQVEPAWHNRTVISLAQAAYDERVLPSGEVEPSRLAVLADALEEAGCADAGLVGHLREPGPHVRGCWAVDRLLAKEEDARTLRCSGEA